MKTPENSPSSSWGTTFPFTDIPLDRNFDRAVAWMDDIEHMPIGKERIDALTAKVDKEQSTVRTTLRVIEEVTDVSAATRLRMNDAGLRIAVRWDATQEGYSNHTRAYNGFLLANSLAIRTDILPWLYADFSTELDELQVSESGQARIFGAAAWARMHINHPRVYHIYDRLNDLIRHTYPTDDTQETLQKAGMGLTYTMAVSTALTKFLPKGAPSEE